jgi:hypothetical protein
MKESDMPSTTEVHSVREAVSDPQTQRGSGTTTKTAFEHFREYGRERPEVVALWCFGIGFVVGWKLKPW